MQLGDNVQCRSNVVSLLRNVTDSKTTVVIMECSLVTMILRS